MRRRTADVIERDGGKMEGLGGHPSRPRLVYPLVSFLAPVPFYFLLSLSNSSGCRSKRPCPWVGGDGRAKNPCSADVGINPRVSLKGGEGGRMQATPSFSGRAAAILSTPHFAPVPKKPSLMVSRPQMGR